MDANIINRLDQLEAFADLIKVHVTVLKKELSDGGASSSSARKGKKVLSEKEIAKILGKRQKNRMRNNH